MCAKHGQKTFRFSKQKMSVKDIQAYFLSKWMLLYITQFIPCMLCKFWLMFTKFFVIFIFIIFSFSNFCFRRFNETVIPLLLVEYEDEYSQCALLEKMLNRLSILSPCSLFAVDIYSLLFVC